MTPLLGITIDLPDSVWLAIIGIATMIAKEVLDRLRTGWTRKLIDNVDMKVADLHTEKFEDLPAQDGSRIPPPRQPTVIDMRHRKR